MGPCLQMQEKRRAEKHGEVDLARDESLLRVAGILFLDVAHLSEPLTLEEFFGHILGSLTDGGLPPSSGACPDRAPPRVAGLPPSSRNSAGCARLPPLGAGELGALPVGSAGWALASGWEAPAGGRPGGRGAAGGLDGVERGFIFPIRTLSLPLHLFLELIEKAPVGTLGDDFLWGALDHANLV